MAFKPLRSAFPTILFKTNKRGNNSPGEEFLGINKTFDICVLCFFFSLYL
jgi:hypothetical protein